METISPENPENSTKLDENLVNASEFLSMAGEYDKAEEVFKLAVEKATDKSWAEVKIKAKALREEVIKKRVAYEEAQSDLNDYDAVLMVEAELSVAQPEESFEEPTETAAIEKMPEAEILPAESSNMTAMVVEAERLAEREANTIATLNETDPEAAELALKESMPAIEKVLGEGAIIPDEFTPAELRKFSEDLTMYAENPGKRMSVVLNYLHAISTIPELKHKLNDNEQARLRAAMKKYGNLSDQDIEEQDAEFYRGVEERLVGVIRSKVSKRMDDYTEPFLVSTFFNGYKVSNFFAEYSLLGDIIPEANVNPAVVREAALEVLQRTDILALREPKGRMAEHRISSARRFLRSINRDYRTEKRGGLTIKQAEAASRCIFEILSLVPDLYELTEPEKEQPALEK